MNKLTDKTATKLNPMIERLRVEQCSCVVSNGQRTKTYHRRGVSDLLTLLHDEEEFLRGSLIADKVVGKGAAALMISGGVAALYAEVISSAALELLRSTDMEVGYALEVPHIINRAGTDICPVEKLCTECQTAAECLPRIEDFVRRMSADRG